MVIERVGRINKRNVISFYSSVNDRSFGGVSREARAW